MVYQCVDCGKRYTKKYESCPNCNDGILVEEDLIAQENTKDAKANTATVHQPHKVIKQKHSESMVCDTCGGTEWTYHKAGLNIRGAIFQMILGILIGIITPIVVLVGGAQLSVFEETYEVISTGIGFFWACIIIALVFWQLVIFLYLVPKTLIKNHGNIYKVCTTCGEAYKLHDNING